MTRGAYCYDVRHYASRDHGRLPAYAVVRIGSGAAKIAKWCYSRDEAEAWIAAHGVRLRR